MEKDRIKCTRCGHTTKPGLTDDNGVCPVCIADEHQRAEAGGAGGGD